MRAALFLALLAVPAHAPCPGDQDFSCQIARKTLEICYWKGMLTVTVRSDRSAAG